MISPGAPDRSLTVSDMDALAHRLSITPHHTPLTRLRNSPVMEGVLLGTEVQSGLFAIGYDVHYLEDVALDQTVEPCLMMALSLDGEVAPMEIEGFGAVRVERNSPFLIGFGEERRCRTRYRAGQRCAASGFNLRRACLERLGELGDPQDFEVLAKLFEKGVSVTGIPASSAMTTTARSLVDNPYSGALARLHVESCVLSLLTETVRLLGEMNRMPPDMSRRHFDQAVRAREILDRDIVLPPTIETLTRELGVNATTLRANFLKAFGTTIFGHVRSRRLETAQYLLKTQDLPVAEVGYRVGFSSPAAFATAYRKRFGHAPSQKNAGLRHH